jgi:hypothetical protein
MAAHASLLHVALIGAPLHTLAVLDAVVDAALACQCVRLRFWSCHLTPASAPALTRLLSGGCLTELSIGQQEQLLDGPSAALLCDVLRANATLTSFSMCADVWRDADAATALLGALTGHSSLRTLMMTKNRVLEASAAAAGAALGALVAANAPALIELDVSVSFLGDAGLRPLFEALPHNTNLRTLNVAGSDMSEAFARDVLLPAVRTNTSLRKLEACENFAAKADAITREAEALAAAR